MGLQLNQIRKNLRPKEIDEKTNDIMNNVQNVKNVWNEDF